MTYPWTTGEVLTAADLNAYAGLVLVKTQTIGTTVSSVTVTSAFSSTFDNYRIVIDCDSASTDAGMELQFGVGNTMTTTGYYWSHTSVSTAGVVSSVGGANDADIAEIAVQTANGFLSTIDVKSPNKALRTAVVANGSDMRTTGNPLRYTGGFHDGTTQFTSFLIRTRSGTSSGGTIRVYGYNNG